MSIYEDILNYLESLEIANVRRFFPFYICSGGAHLFNRFNRQRTVVTSHGLPIDLRMHLFFVSQPGFCLHPRTQILMEDGTKKLIRDIEIGDRLASITGQKNIVMSRMERTIGKIYKIQPHNLRCSSWHKVLTQDGWKYAKNLKVGDTLITAFTSDELRMLGFWLAEGRYEGYWTPIISNKDEDLLEVYEEIQRKFGNHLKYRGKREYACTHGIKSTTYPNMFSQFLRYLGYPRDTNSHNKSIPEELLTIPFGGKQQLLYGMWDGDGQEYQGKRGQPQLRYASVSDDLISDVSAILNSMNINHSIYMHDPCKEIYIHAGDRHKLFDEMEDTIWKGSTEVTDISKYAYSNSVIDLGTTGSHLIANNTVVHNSKTFSMRIFSNPVYGIFSRTDINPAWEDRMTEARFSGTIYQDQRGVVKQVYGAAYEYSNCILCVDEFHALANTMTQQHSSTLESALCTALDSGWVRKGLGRGKLEYQTSVTMWAGAQPMRYDLGQGTGRRFVFLEFIPSEDDEETIRQAMRRGKNVKHDMLKLNAIRRDIRNLWTDINRIDNVWFNPEIDRYYDRIKIMPYEEHLFNVIAIGYNIMHGDVKRDFEINIDDELKRLFDLENEWRHDIKKGPETSQILQIIRDNMNKHNIKWVPKIDIQNRMADFGVNFQKSNELIFQLIREGLVTKKVHPSHKGKREECVALI